jgi:tetratricopeptide (TPR) repeat protein
MHIPSRQYLALIALVTALAAPFGLAALLSPADLCQVADEDARRYEFDLALYHLHGALRGKPHSPEVVYLKTARMARRAERLKQAEEYLAEAARLGADAPALKLERTLLRAQKGYAARVRDGLASHLEPEDPDSELVWEALGRGYLRAYRLREAEECFKALLRLRPDSMPGWLGWAETRRQEPYIPWGFIPLERARSAYERVVALAPSHFQARLRLAEALLVFQEGPRVEAAVRHLRILLARQPKHVKARVLLAEALLVQGEDPEARALLAGVLRDHPRFLPALLLEARLPRKGRDQAEAARWYRLAPAVDATEPEVLFRMARYLLRKGQRAEADVYLKRWREVEAARDRLEVLKQQMAGRLTVKDPADPALRYEAGLIALRLGRAEEGMLWWTRALIEDPNHGATHRALADYYEKAGQSDLASWHRRQASGGGP